MKTQVFWLGLSSGCPIVISGLCLAEAGRPIEDGVWCLCSILLLPNRASILHRCPPSMKQGRSQTLAAGLGLFGCHPLLEIGSVLAMWSDCPMEGEDVSAWGPSCGKLHLSLKPGKLVVFLLALGTVSVWHPQLCCQPEDKVRSEDFWPGKEGNNLDSCWYPCVAESTSPEACLATGRPFVWDDGKFFIG